MMKIQAKVIADSINKFGNRITSFVVVFPRIILSELNTHRMFSRNSASSRAVPFEKVIEIVQHDPFIPIAWQKDHKGMQGTKYITNETTLKFLRENHLYSRQMAMDTAMAANALGLTKQICNRYLEPFMWHTAIITTTELANFFELRCPKYNISAFHTLEDNRIRFKSKKDAMQAAGGKPEEVSEFTDLEWLQMNQGQAEIHMMALAETMWDAYYASTPKILAKGEWHIPFGDHIDEQRLADDMATYELKALQKEEGYKSGSWSKHGNFHTHEEIEKAKIAVATARCARVSYFNYEGKDDYEADIKLYDNLLSSKHMSPYEHCAKAMDDQEYSDLYGIASPGFTNGYQRGWCRNFRGFTQLRAMIENNS